MVSLVAIARTELLRLLRDRSNVFFVFVFPLLLVVLIGVSFGEGGGQTNIGVVAPADEAVDRVVQRIDEVDGFTVVELDDADALRDRVSDARVAVGIVLPDGFGAALAAGTRTEVGFVSRPAAGAARPRAAGPVLVDLREPAELDGGQFCEVLAI
jgi:ABC-2 type transport system permease protein